MFGNQVVGVPVGSSPPDPRWAAPVRRSVRSTESERLTRSLRSWYNPSPCGGKRGRRSNAREGAVERSQPWGSRAATGVVAACVAALLGLLVGAAPGTAAAQTGPGDAPGAILVEF